MELGVLFNALPIFHRERPEAVLAALLLLLRGQGKEVAELLALGSAASRPNDFSKPVLVRRKRDAEGCMRPRSILGRGVLQRVERLAA